MSKRTSIIVTTHNYAAYLEQCLDSLIAQTLQPLEIIVINDSSSDNTDQVVEKYTSNDGVYYYKVDFRSAQKSRNFGLSKALGEYILNMDADNYLDSHFLEKTQRILDENDDIALAYTDHKVFGDDNLIAQTAQGKDWLSKEFDYNSLKKMNYIDTTSLVRKRDFEGFDENVRRFQDWDAWLTFLKDKKAKRVPEQLLYKRLHEQSKTMTVQLYMERLRVMAKHDLIEICNDEQLQQNIEKAKGKTIIIMNVDGESRAFVKKVIKRKKSRDILFYFINEKQQASDLTSIKDLLRKNNVIYRVSRGTLDQLFKGIRMNNCLPLYSVDYLAYVNSGGGSNMQIPSRSCDATIAAHTDIVKCKNFDEIDHIVFNKRGIRKLLNP
jgi:glycosyltransferase involved in cell wall biosynthesis